MLLDEHKELANSPHLGSLKFSARYLLSLVNDILHINKINGKPTSQPSVINPNAITDGVYKPRVEIPITCFKNAIIV